MSRFFSIITAQIPIPEASHSISKALLKSGKDTSGAEINFDFNKLNALSCSSPHLNPTDFLMISVNGEAIVLKSLTNLL
jgi:U3 small nucleolar RNA-associated protein 14